MARSTASGVLEGLAPAADKRMRSEDMAAVSDLINLNRRGMRQDLESGRKRGAEIFGKGSLGEIKAKRSTEVSDFLARQKANLEGYTPQEQQAFREQNMRSVMANQAAGARDLRRQQAASGVRGAMASNQQAAMQQATQGQLADQERQLFLNQIAEKRAALANYGQGVQGAEGFERQGAQFNLGQREKEKAGQLTTEMGYGSLGSANRASAQEFIAAQRAAEAARAAARK